MERGEREFRIGFIGVSERMLAAYEMALAQRRSELRLATPAEVPDIVIVDVDGVGAEKAWHEYARLHPGVRAVAVSAARPTVDWASATLRKPLRFDEFWAALERVANDLRSAHARAVAAKDKRAAAATAAQKGRPAQSVSTLPPPSPPPATQRPAAAKPAAAKPAAAPAPLAPLGGKTPAAAVVQESSAPVRSLSPSAAEKSEAVTAAERTVTMTVEPITQTVTLLAKPSVKAAPAVPAEASAKSKKSPAFDPGDPSHWERRRQHADNRLLGILRRAMQQPSSASSAWEVHYRDEPILWISGSARRAGLYVEEGLIERLAALVVSDEAIVMKPLSLHAARACPSKPLENFLWQLATWTYRGRYPAELDPEALYFLRRWPNLPRLPAPPQAMRLAALFVAQPMTMKYVVRELGFAPEAVFAFCAGAYSAGLLEPAKRSADSLFEPAVREKTKPVQRAVLQRIVGYLRRLVT